MAYIEDILGLMDAPLLSINGLEVDAATVLVLPQTDPVGEGMFRFAVTDDLAIKKMPDPAVLEITDLSLLAFRLVKRSSRNT